ncbi:MAG TPA: sodium:calcium antiporter [Chloroflexota bacterium]|nr:sodium:calcium antiporter [Chloroflexota bacterium]
MDRPIDAAGKENEQKMGTERPSGADSQTAHAPGSHGAGPGPAADITATAEGRAEHAMDELRASRSGWVWMALTASLALPWLLFRTLVDFHHSPPALVALLTGVAILSAAFILSWAAEVFQLDVSQALALALLSLIAVLPEYAVDVVFAWRAAADPTQAPYAVANMTGANRLLIGVGWSSVVLVAWWRARRRRSGAPDAAVVTSDGGGTSVTLERSQALELGALALATLYSFFIPLKGGIGLLDAVVLGSLFAVYAWGTARAPAEHPELVGPAATVATLAPAARRVATVVMFLFAAFVIFASAEPFAEGLVNSGASLGVDEFLLVQWVAPFASESPEFLVALLFAWRGMAQAGLRTLVASKVNQWTLLIGSLGVAYSIALGAAQDLPLDARQTEELFLTSAQSLFALALIANFDLSVRESLFLLGTFLLQLVFPGQEVRLAMAVAYMVMVVYLLASSRSRRDTLLQIPSMIRETITRPPVVPVEAGDGRTDAKKAGTAV